MPLPKSLDLSHHLSTLSVSRHPSPLKDIINYMNLPGMISLAGGLPHPSFFPITSVRASAYPQSTVLDPANPVIPGSSASGASGSGTVELSVPREPGTSPFFLTDLLQYSAPAGHPKLRQFARDLATRLYPPAYADWDVLLNCGSTDGWCKVAGLLLERDDYVLCEEQIYPSAQALFIPMGCKAVPIPVDGDGMLPAALSSALGDWDEKVRGRPRPHVLYIVPVGQNPLGTTMKAERRKQIYDVCKQFDVIIVEDDPYTMLQYGEYTLGEARTGPAATEIDAFVTGMEKSFLNIDTDGRVIRLDTFSKTLAPGARLGWFTANPVFIERLLRATEVQTQAPAGLSQAVIGQLLEAWGMDGYLEWLTNLKEQYRVRRDWMIDAIAESFELVPSSSSGIPGAEGLVAFVPGSSRAKPVFSFVPPTGGMFLWCKVYYSTNPSFSKAEPPVTEAEFERAFWQRLADQSVLVTPGWYYTPWQGAGVQTVTEKGVGHFRLAFSYETKADMEEGIRRLAKAMTAEWTA